MDELAKKMAELGTQYGPHVIESARGAALLAAYSSLQTDIIATLIGIALVVAARKLWRKNARDDIDMPIGRIGAGILFCIAGISLCIGISGLTDPWLWATFKHPDLWLAKRTLGL